MEPETKKKLLKFARQAAYVGSEVAEIAVHLRKVTPLTAFSVGAKVFNALDQVFPTRPEDLIRGWTCVSGISAVDLFCFSVCRSQGIVKSERDTFRPNQKAPHDGEMYFGELYGLRIAWRYYGTYVEGPWIEGNETDFFVRMGRLIWETIGNTAKAHIPSGSHLHVVPDTMTEIFPSQRGRDIYERIIKPFRDHGEGRALLFYGEPGTGKSCLMRYLAQIAGGFSLRIPCRELERIRNPAVVVNLLQPSALLLDDLDRVENPEAILSQIEEIRSQDVLFLVSINNVERLDPATIRPGRFDEYIHIDKLDDDILDAKLKGAPEKTANILRQLPIAYVDAYHNYVKRLGPEAALRHVQELQDRHALVSKLCGSENKPTNLKHDDGTPSTHP